MPTLEYWQALRARFAAQQIPSAALDARLIVEHVVAQPLHRAEQFELSAPARARLEALAARRLAGEPIARLFGRREFYGHEFALTPAVLDPRADSETLVEAALARLPAAQKLRALELGTGSGALSIALLRARPRLTILAVDKSAAALAVARTNARQHKVTARMRLRASDWFSHVSGRFAMIIANPPYVAHPEWAGLAREVRADPFAALNGGTDGMAPARRILACAKPHLATGGFLVMEHGSPPQAERLSEYARAYGWGESQRLCDLAGQDRVLVWQAK